ncbi:hypothetical protein DL765_004246 [Monosporascus sp. GIB2]|nr:hypothetical protein DL765_004246 [Monosporascus sp. GIB2]
MGGGNGAKAAQKRARKQDQTSKKGPTSQLKKNEKFNSEHSCRACTKPYNHTVPESIFIEHAKGHGKDPRVCFPDYPFKTI